MAAADRAPHLFLLTPGGAVPARILSLGYHRLVLETEQRLDDDETCAWTAGMPGVPNEAAGRLVVRRLLELRPSGARVYATQILEVLSGADVLDEVRAWYAQRRAGDRDGSAEPPRWGEPGSSLHGGPSRGPAEASRRRALRHALRQHPAEGSQPGAGGGEARRGPPDWVDALRSGSPGDPPAPAAEDDIADDPTEVVSLAPEERLPDPYFAYENDGAIPRVIVSWRTFASFKRNFDTHLRGRGLFVPNPRLGDRDSPVDVVLRLPDQAELRCRARVAVPMIQGVGLALSLDDEAFARLQATRDRAP